MKKLIILCTAQSLILFAPPKNKNQNRSVNNQVTTIQSSVDNEDTVKIESSNQEKSLCSSQHSFKAEDLPQEIKASSNFILDASTNSPKEDDSLLKKVSDLEASPTTSKQSCKKEEPTKETKAPSGLISEAPSSSTQEDKKKSLNNGNNEESFDDLSFLNEQTHRGTNFSEQVITTAYSCVRTAKKMGAQCGILSRIKYYNEIVTSQQAHADYIASTATSANPHKGYHDLENAILEAISSGTIENIKAALDLFKNIYPYKSYLTQETLKKISDASKKYQEHLDFEHKLTTLAYLKETELITFLKAESDKIDGISNFTKQEDTVLLEEREKTVKRLKEFASQNKSSQQELKSDLKNNSTQTEDKQTEDTQTEDKQPQDKKFENKKLEDKKAKDKKLKNHDD